MQPGHKVVIVGGGFAGVEAARRLARLLPKHASITLISDKTYFEYYPALYRVVTLASPIEVTVSLADVVPARVSIVHDEVMIVDPTAKEVVGARTGGYRYDTLVLAAGSVMNDFGIPGVREHARAFRGIGDAMRLKNELHRIVRTCPVSATPETCYQVAIVGGGPTGVELAGDVVTYLRKSAAKSGVDSKAVQVILFEAAPRVLMAASDGAASAALRKLQKLGVDVRTEARITGIAADGVLLGETKIPARLVIWGAGAKPAPLYERIPGLSFGKAGRVEVDAQLRAAGQPDIFVLGDGAVTPKAGLAQTALTDGAFAAKVIARVLRGKQRLPKYRPPFVAHAIPIGRRSAILSMPGLTVSGFIPYLIRHFIDFDFFAGWLSLPKMLDLFWAGYKYRRERHEE